MKNSPRFSKLRVENLEERTLLAVMAGGVEQAVTFPEPTESTTWWVATAEDTFEGDVLSLRDALAQAQSGDTVRFVPELSGGIITMSEMSLTIPYFAVQKGVTVDASDLPGGITIDANGISRVFYIYGGTDSEPTVLKGLTITGGSIANDGGGIYVTPGTVTLEDCTVTGNHLSGPRSLGAGICNRGTLTVTNCIVSGNTTEGYGGGIFNSGTLTVTDTVISGNQNCGIYQNQGTVTVTDSIIVGNSADTGGGIYHSSGTLTLTNCTVSRNSAARYGGGIFTLFLSPSDISIRNSVIARNTAANDGNEIYKNSLSAVICACNTLSSYTDWTESENCLEYDPNLPLFTDAENGDYRLAAGSQAINAGNNDFVAAETDLAGNPRIGGGIVDLGAYECQTEAPSTVVTTFEDVIDETDGLISLREAVNYAAEGDTVTFASELCGGTIVLAGSEIAIDKAITIDATAVNGITIDANQQSRIFSVSGGTENAPVVLAGLTIVRGSESEEGAVFNEGVLNLVDSCFMENLNKGVSNIRGTLTLINCDISKNTGSTDWGGGGIYNLQGTLTLSNCSISENTIKGNAFGGGICSVYGTVALTGCTISKNVAISSSGSSVGGGIHVDSGTLDIIGCTISGNYADYGGSVFITDAFDSILKSTISNCVIIQNSAKTGGGIMLHHAHEVIITNCTVSGNIAEDCGGVYIFISSSTPPQITNCILSLNYGDDINSRYDVYAGSNNIIGIDPGFIVAPIFDEYGNLINAESLDLSLSETSIAVDAGDNRVVIGETDIAGNPRIVNGIVDIGAYENQSASPVEQLASPTILTGNKGVYVSYGANRHQMTWNAVENASGYELAYSADGNSWTTISATDTVAVVTGLAYGQDVKYRVRALGTGTYTDSDWSEIKTFNVCPMDIDGDDFIGPGDYAIMSYVWFSEKGGEEFIAAADINGDGYVSGGDSSFLANNWFLEAGDADLDYPTPKAADIVFTEFESADLNTDLSVF